MVRKERGSAALRASKSTSERAQKQNHNNPVPVEEFDREQMGIAAKE
jgi:hypothetical protein